MPEPPEEQRGIADVEPDVLQRPDEDGLELSRQWRCRINGMSMRLREDWLNNPGSGLHNSSMIGHGQDSSDGEN